MIILDSNFWSYIFNAHKLIEYRWIIAGFSHNLY